VRSINLNLPRRHGRTPFRDQPETGAAHPAPGLRSGLARKRGDGVIDRSKTREIPCWPMALTGRRLVWTSCRGNHFGQRSCATATRGRTYDCKRSDQNIIQHPCETGAVHICHVYGLICGHSHAAGPDEVRGSGPIQSGALEARCCTLVFLIPSRRPLRHLSPSIFPRPTAASAYAAAGA
jgi:hypothetical protein